ncbi:hypothetical protein ZIOFF_072924 [Zingiber officinale]|uniref:Uncharacterized protein n=1 Tax=Zingiber officinale TaxID=94328 RepID=A0A8J5EM32_ZINOF|nr:hypothetical protein ZIOFF_072924 [Zingiber officinale]
MSITQSTPPATPLVLLTRDPPIPGIDFIIQVPNSGFFAALGCLGLISAVDNHIKANYANIKSASCGQIVANSKAHMAKFTNLKYSRVEIDEVRFEWAECMLDYI